MTIEPLSPARLSKVSELTTALSDVVLDAQIMGRPVPEEQTRALAKAARLLQDHGVAWPPLLAQVLHDLTPDSDAAAQQPEVAMPSVDLHGLSRFFSGLRKGRAEP